MANLSSPAVEKKLLSFFTLSPYHTRLVSAGSGIYNTKEYRTFADLAIKYIDMYKQPITEDTFRLFCSDVAKTDDDIDKAAEAISVVSDLDSPVSTEFEYLIKKAKNYSLGRKIFDIAKTIKDGLSGSDELDFFEMRKNLVNSILTSESDDENIKRGFIYDNAKSRAEIYKKKMSHEDDADLIPFGMEPLDNHLMGMRKTYLTLIYSKTGGGKTRTAMNIAYNNAIAGRNVLYFTLEMAFDLFASCIDSRIAMLDSKKIIFGKLSDDERKSYADALRKQMKEKLNLWIVDIPMGTTSQHIHNEIETYKLCTGRQPDLVIVDYAFLVEPTKKYGGRSEKYDILFKEFHEIARMHNVALITGAQESRDATKADKKKKDEDEDVEGVDNLGASAFMAPHCEMVLRLKQTRFDRDNNRLMVVVDKCRYGQVGTQIPLVALFDKSYVGGNKIPNLTPRGVRIKKESHENSQDEDKTGPVDAEGDPGAV